MISHGNESRTLLCCQSLCQAEMLGESENESVPFVHMCANSLWMSYLMRYVDEPLPNIEDSSCAFSSCELYQPPKSFGAWCSVSLYAETGWAVSSRGHVVFCTAPGSTLNDHTGHVGHFGRTGQVAVTVDTFLGPLSSEYFDLFFSNSFYSFHLS